MASWLTYALALGLQAHRGLEETSDATSSEGTEAEEGVEALGVFSLATLVLCLVALIIVLSIMFELFKEYLEEHTSETLEPVLAAMFSELTTLGFLSLLTYLLQETDVFVALSDAIFGFDVIEEVFETAHMGIFAVAVIFMLEVVIFLGLGKELEESWKRENADTLDKEKMASLEAKFVGGQSLGMSKQQAERLFEFQSFRNEFIRKRDIIPPFAYAKKNDQLTPDFDFGKYLTECYAHTMAEVIELPPTVWACILGMLGVFYFMMLACETQLGKLMWVWLVLGYWLVADMYILHSRVNYARAMMIVPTEIPKPGSLSGLTTSTRDMRTHLMVELDRPMWTTLDVPKPNPKGWKARLFGAVQRNRMERLFIFGNKGGKSYTFFLQLMMFCNSIYLTTLFIVFYEYAFTEESLLVAFLYLVFSLIPSLLLFQNFVHLMRDLIMVTSTGPFRHTDVISKVIRHQKASRAINTLLLISKLRNSTVMGSNHHDEPKSMGKRRSSLDILKVEHEKGTRRQSLTVEEAQQQLQEETAKDKIVGDPLTLISADQVENVGHTFDTFDKDHSGEIETSEVVELLTALGMSLTGNQLKMVELMLDVDNSGSVSKAEFIWWYAKQLKHADDFTLEEVVHSLFTLIDTDNTGSITLSEFYNTIKTLGGTLELDDVADLFREIDTDGSGSVDREEFEGMLIKYLGSDLL